MAKIYAKMDTLREEASSKGGVVISLLGNHEWMNLLGDWRDVESVERTELFASDEARFEALTNGSIGQSWKENYMTASRLPFHPSLGLPNTPYPSDSASVDESALSHAALSFVHGGLSPTYSRLTPFPAAINDVASSLLHRLQTRNPLPKPHPSAKYIGFPENTPAEEIELFSGNGPVWYREWAHGGEYQICKKVGGVLRKTGTRRMIMGHTRFDSIISRCKGKIIIIDTGEQLSYCIHRVGSQ